jgi:hypothetical protein
MAESHVEYCFSGRCVRNSPFRAGYRLYRKHGIPDAEKQGLTWRRSDAIAAAMITWKTQMFRQLTAPSPREIGKYCAYALILLAPGSFVVLPVLWLVRQFFVPASRQGTEFSAGGLRSSAKIEVGAKT